MQTAAAAKKTSEFFGLKDTGPLEELGKKMMHEEKHYIISKALDPEKLYRKTQKEIEEALH